MITVNLTIRVSTPRARCCVLSNSRTTSASPRSKGGHRRRRPRYL